MTSSRDLENLLGNYLEDGPTELPDRSYDAVRTAIETTDQRVVFGPWRKPSMFNFARLAAVGVAVLMLSLAGIYLVPLQSKPVGVDVTPSPAPTPQLMTATNDFITLGPGTYVTGAPFDVRVTFTLPAMSDGWEGRIGGPYLTVLGTATTDLLDFTFIDKVVSNPCDASHTVMNPQPGASANDLANALASLPLLDSTAPTDVTIGGIQGKHLMLTAPATGRACAPWVDPLGNDYELAPGADLPLWLVDVGDKTLFITAPPHDTPLSADTQAAVQAVLDSIQLAPVGTPSGSPPAAVTTSPSPSAPPRSLPNLQGNASVPLTAGTYAIDDSTMTNAQHLTLTVPSGWVTVDGYLIKNQGKPNEVMLVTYVIDSIFSDVCHWGTLNPVGTTVDELMQALTKQAGRTATLPNSVLIGGFEAQHSVLTVPADLDITSCKNATLRFWPDPGPDQSGGLTADRAGNIDVVYGVDVNGNRLVVVARHYPGSSDADIGELQGMLSSMRIVPLPHTAPPAPTASASPYSSPSGS
jgi:hypothetical protein